MLKGELMSTLEQATVITPLQQKVLDELQGGARTWDEIRRLTKIHDDGLGLMLGGLLSLRKIWTMLRGDVRVYGIERRTGLVPRFANERRRASDSHL
jgi:hypothetical protein